MRRITLVVSAVALLAACGGPPAPATTDIRSVDFGAMGWHDDYLRVDVRMAAGVANVPGRQAAPGHAATFRVTGAPVYADADGDGVLDAAVPTALVVGNGEIDDWYLWLWRDGSAHQLDHPMARGARCGDVIKSVTPAADGFAVTRLVKPVGTVCAEAPTIPASSVIGARGDYPVQVRPAFGAPEWCEQSQHGTRLAGVDATPRVAPEPAAPQVTTGRRWTRVLLADQLRATDPAGGVWHLALVFDDPAGTHACGWIPR
jgi:hypothetical protein